MTNCCRGMHPRKGVKSFGSECIGAELCRDSFQLLYNIFVCVIFSRPHLFSNNSPRISLSKSSFFQSVTPTAETSSDGARVHLG